MAALDDTRTRSIYRASARIFFRPLPLRRGSLTPVTLQPKTRRRAPPDARRRAPLDLTSGFARHSIPPDAFTGASGLLCRPMRRKSLR